MFRFIGIVTQVTEEDTDVVRVEIKPTHYVYQGGNLKGLVGRAVDMVIDEFVASATDSEAAIPVVQAAKPPVVEVPAGVAIADLARAHDEKMADIQRAHMETLKGTCPKLASKPVVRRGKGR